MKRRAERKRVGVWGGGEVRKGLEKHRLETEKGWRLRKEN